MCSMFLSKDCAVDDETVHVLLANLRLLSLEHFTVFLASNNYSLYII